MGVLLRVVLWVCHEEARGAGDGHSAGGGRLERLLLMLLLVHISAVYWTAVGLLLPPSSSSCRTFRVVNSRL